LSAEHTEQRSLDLTGITTVEVATFNGRLSISAGDEPPRLEATLTGKATYEVERLGNLLYIAGKKAGFTFGGTGVSFRLWLPAGLMVKLSTAAASVRVRGPLHALTASTYQGDILTEETGAADLRLKVASSNVEVREAGGRVDVSASHGDIRVAGGSSDVRVATGHGAVSVAQTTGRVHITSGHGEMRLSGVKGQIKVSTGHGSVAIDDSEGEIQVATGRGELRLARVTFPPGSHSWLKTGSGPAEVRSISAPGGMRLSLKVFTGSLGGALGVELPGYSIQLSRSSLRAELPGSRPARLEIVAPVGVRIGG
jgi:hypothetical protein